MSWAVNNVAGSVAGTQQQARVSKRDVDRKEPAKQKRQFRDEFNQLAETSEADHADAVRSLKDNTQEEAHEDRQEHAGQQTLASEHRDEPAVYTPQPEPARQAAPPRSRLDLEG
ncbi:MAG: hypothetical protein H6810_01435 [Phycisphaeraceae bacterium]|nr:MAG: hypothetical protein H6810_01435 [Phycisphaeraceae bacterium]